INSKLNTAGFVHHPHKYGFFLAVQMLIPPLRRRRVDAFREFYESVKQKASETPISLIAHSFGTYIAANAMDKYLQVTFDQIIFCGSIAQRDYDWNTIIRRHQAKRILNDYGGKDIWVRLVEWGVPDSGTSGRLGFNIDPPNTCVIQQKHSKFRHSDHFYP